MINDYIVLINHIIFYVSDFFFQSNVTNSNFLVFGLKKFMNIFIIKLIEEF